MERLRADGGGIEMNRRRPNLFMVGAPKAGTSAMFTYLRQHPDITFASTKEPHYFGRDHRRLNHAPRTEAQYLELFTAAKGEKWVGDASTSYLHSSTAAKEISAFSPGARIIIMLREPVDAMYALHGTVLQSGFEFVADFRTALSLEEERKNGHRLPRIRPGLLENLLYRDTVRYYGQVKRFLDLFGRERVHIALYDDFARCPAVEFRRVLQFLEVDADFEPVFAVVNASRRPRSTSLNNLLWNPPPVIQATVRTALPSRVRASSVSWLKRLNVTPQKRPPLDDRLRAQLNSELSAEVDRLAALINRDLSHWCGRMTTAPCGAR